MHSDALFETGLPQAWLPDETLFSLCSRYHLSSGAQRASTTCRALFGHPRQGSAHDFPARLGHFLAVSRGALGSVREIAEARTVLALYLRFANPKLSASALNAIASPSGGSLKFHLGLPASRFRANHPLKACLLCMEEDRANYGTPYWHREHQLPGVWICRRHGCMLSASDLKATGVARFQWILPSPSQFSAPGMTRPSDAAIGLAHMVIHAVSQQTTSFNPEVLASVYRTALQRRELLGGKACDRLRRVMAGSAYADHVAPLARLEQLQGLPASAKAAANEISKLIGTVRTGMHPLRHLALANWLFRDFDEFLDLYETARLGRTPLPPLPQGRAPVTSDHPSKAKFIALVRGGQPVTAAARSAGVDTTTGMAWAAADGIPTPRRPKYLRGDVRLKVIAALEAGVSKVGAANLGQISVQSITTLLRTEVGLRERWRQAQFAEAQRHHRAVWSRSLAANVQDGIKIARLAQPASYAWLYRHDRDWLVRENGRIERVSRSNGSRVPWDARDSVLAAEIRKTALAVALEAPSRRIKLWQLYQRLPELKAKLSKLDRLPLCRTAILEVTSAQPIETLPIAGTTESS